MKANRGKCADSSHSLLLLLLMFLIITVFNSFPAYAERGVGIKWYTEAEIMKEETTRCLNYGIYNPWSEDVNAILRASDEFSPVVAEQTSEPVFVAAGTSSSDALHSDLCFKMGDVYDENCLLGPLLCERTCPQERFEYAGQVIVEEAPRDAELRGTGSGTTFGVAAPLRLIVDCQNLQRDYTPLLFVGGIVGGVATAVAVKRHRSHGKKGRKKYHFVIKI